MANPTFAANPEATRPSQAFRVPPSSSTLSIDAHLDYRTGQYVILWLDVQRIFEDVHYVKQGSSVVSLMSDQNFRELQPPRIPYRPGVVFDVVLRDPVHESLPEKQIDPSFVDTKVLQGLETGNDTSADRVLNDLQSTLRHLPECLTSIRDLLQVLAEDMHALSDQFCDTTAAKPRVEPMDFPEIRDLVFQNLDRKDFVTCARLNKAWR
ncbi:hypothetical protein BGZ54_008592, partial [Gamsiella multidivaricata]